MTGPDVGGREREFVLLLSCAIPAEDRDAAEAISSKIQKAASRLGCNTIHTDVQDPDE